MFTGLYPFNHGVTPLTDLSERRITLADHLSAAGYATGGFVGSAPWLDPWRGFVHGFDEYDHPEGVRDFPETRIEVQDWLDRLPTDQFFLFFHNFDAHSRYHTETEVSEEKYRHPYYPSDPEYVHFAAQYAPVILTAPDDSRLQGYQLLYAHNAGRIRLSKEIQQYIIDLYDDAVRYVDAAVGGFVEHLKQRDLYDKALIIVTSDHGEAFDQHGNYGHTDVYEPVLHVPLLVKFPHQKFGGRRVSEMVQSVDLLPTICDVLGLDIPPGIDGHSLMGVIEGEAAPPQMAMASRILWNAVRTNQADGWSHTERETLQAVRSPDWKLIHTASTDRNELYHLAVDPGEQHDLADSENEFLTLLERARRAHFRPPGGFWRLIFETGPDSWQPRVGLRFESRLVRASFEQQGESTPAYSQALDERHARAWEQFTIAPESTAVLELETDAVQSRIHLNLSSEAPFHAQTPGGGARFGGTTELLLDPYSEALVSGEFASEDTEGPAPNRLEIQYVPPRVDVEESRLLDTSAVEQLKALGYL